MSAMTSKYEVGDHVIVDSHEGFGGVGPVLAVLSDGRYRVELDCYPEPCIVWDHEISGQPPMVPYSSEAETRAHQRVVANLLIDMATRLLNRAKVHDDSKLAPEEKPFFDQATPRLKGLTYGSPEYRESLKIIGPAIDHHNRVNSHHPEHYSDGVDSMDLMDLVEMLCDWKAATLRHEDGDIRRSLEINRKRFHLSDQLASILSKTVERYLMEEPRRDSRTD